MKIFLNIACLFLFASCADKGMTPKHTDVFYYANAKTGDTTRFFGYRDLDTALYFAKAEKKNILVIFSGWACMSVHGLEWKTLSLYGNANKINNNFVIAWLAVDDKSPAKDTSQRVFWYGKQRHLTDMGDQYKYFEETVFHQSTQPLFCFIDSTKKPFGKVMGYTRDEDQIEAFIESGLNK
jgi:hypothetical protein